MANLTHQIPADASVHIDEGDLVAEASDIGLSPGSWPMMMQFRDILFVRSAIDRDPEGEIQAVLYRHHARARHYLFTVLND